MDWLNAHSDELLKTLGLILIFLTSRKTGKGSEPDVNTNSKAPRVGNGISIQIQNANNLTLNISDSDDGKRP